MKYHWLHLTLLLCSPTILAANDADIIIGSKKFTESIILGELASQITGSQTRHQQDIGGSRILWNALLNGEIDIYPEYTGTLLYELLAKENMTSPQALNNTLAKYGIGATQALGFNNTYALGMQSEQAKALNIKRISDLRKYPQLRFGFSNEFINRNDGWPGLKKHYALPQTEVRGLDHDLAYRGLQSKALDIIDLYTTDAEINYYQLITLKDDLNYFPAYYALFLYRLELEKSAPDIIKQLKRLENILPAHTMTSLNAKAKLERIPTQHVAADFLKNKLAMRVDIKQASLWSRLWQRTLEHLSLVSISLSAAILVSIPLGIIAFYRPSLGQWILSVAGVLQTIPSLALLVFMIPLLGIGGPPAIVALFLYSLLPIIRNTYTGLHDIPTSMRESAQALGLTTLAQLRLIELPLATRAILAGIKTSAVINIGTATLGALIGAGGYGQAILTGIRLDDVSLILEGAIPAALLALFAQAAFDRAEKYFVPQGLKR